MAAAKAARNVLELAKPDDFHVHLRDGTDILGCMVPAVARQFRRAICMPNLKPPVTTTAMALEYRERILMALPSNLRATFEPMMTLYLTEQTPPEEIEKAAASGIRAVKLYPAGATTNSAHGVRDVEHVLPALRMMAKHKMPLLIHGEIPDGEVDVFDREREFLERVMPKLIAAVPDLKIVLEHITTSEAVAFVLAAAPNVGATVTAHHLLINRNALLAGGLNPHHYCMPIVKRESHRQALLKAVTSGSPKFFAGTDSAPHPKHAKLSACGCAGVYTAHAAVELYAEAFEQANALDHLEAFMSKNGAAFYGLEPNTERIKLVRAEWQVADELPFGDTVVVPFRAGSTIKWRLESA
jgi:dihydroorotase